jgi:anti-sigma-K factor RskA
VLSGSNGSGTLLRTPQGEALLAAHLPPLQQGRVYQLWLIQGNNPPVDGGTFTVDQRGQGLLAVASTQQVLAANTFAVTDEPGPDGSLGPTTDPLIVGAIEKG